MLVRYHGATDTRKTTMTVAFQAERGAYSEAALLKHFGEGTETLA